MYIFTMFYGLSMPLTLIQRKVLHDLDTSVSAGEIKTEALFFFKSEIGNRQLLRLNNMCRYHFCNILHICSKIT